MVAWKHVLLLGSPWCNKEVANPPYFMIFFCFPLGPRKREERKEFGPFVPKSISWAHFDDFWPNWSLEMVHGPI